MIVEGTGGSVAGVRRIIAKPAEASSPIRRVRLVVCLLGDIDSVGWAGDEQSSSDVSGTGLILVASLMSCRRIMPLHPYGGTVAVPELQAYAILDGGGMLGCALAGCLLAAEQEGIRFCGYGGTSAGSLVATLSSVGYSAAELEKLLIETEFHNEVLGGDGVPVDELKARAARFFAELDEARTSPRWSWLILRPARKGLRALATLSGLVGSLGLDHGVDDGGVLREFLLKYIKKKQPSLGGYDVTFRDLCRLEKPHPDGPCCQPLKLVASHLNHGRPALFGLDHSEYGASVIDAVRASTCYPFVFRPHKINGWWLVDGGLASNLPAFLFHEEQRSTHLPAICFDLVSKKKPAPKSYPIDAFLKDMAGTALDAGDELMRDVLQRRIVHVPIEVPDEYDVLDFRMDRGKRASLFNEGYKQASLYFKTKYQPLVLLKEYEQQDMQQAIQAQFGPPAPYMACLRALCEAMEARSAARDVRATIMLPTGRGTRMVVYSYNMIRRVDGHRVDSGDSALEIATDAGCSGEAFVKNEASFDDLAEARTDPARRKMTAKQYMLIAGDRRAILSFPIRGELSAKDLEERTKPPPIASLTVDSITPLDDTQWLEGSPGSERRSVTESVASLMEDWSYIIGRLFPW